MNYEINVALNGKHFFATAERSIRDEHHAAVVLVLFQEKFPTADGYSITCTRWDKVGTPMSAIDLWCLIANK